MKLEVPAARRRLARVERELELVERWPDGCYREEWEQSVTAYRDWLREFTGWVDPHLNGKATAALSQTFDRR